MTHGLSQRGLTLLAGFVALLSGCGSSIVAPELPRSPVIAGNYLLLVSATDAPRTCVGSLDAWRVPPLPDSQPSVSGMVRILSNGTGRSPSPADGTVEIQFDNAPGAAAVTGTLSGRLAHFAGQFGSRSAAFTATAGVGPARFHLERVGTESPPIYFGTVAGTIVFTASDGSVVTCPEAAILLGSDR